MDFIPHAPLNRIPGTLVAKEKHTKDLTKLTRAELLEMKDREWKLLSNKTRLGRLPDKGKRIQEYYAKVLAELERRDSVDEAAALFSNLNIATKAKTALNNLEWHGQLREQTNVDPSEDLLDSDDDMDPLRVLAQRTMHERRVQVLPVVKNTLITAKDLAEIKTFQIEDGDVALSSTESTCNEENNNSNEKTDAVGAETIAAVSQATTPKPDADDNALVEQHVLYLIEKTEPVLAAPHREKFKPYKTTASNVHDPAKERLRKMGKHWEVTAATPPLIQHNATQLLPLMDSVAIQTEYLERLKSLQRQQAEERLARRLAVDVVKMSVPDAEALKSTKAFRDYRTPQGDYNTIEGNQRLNKVMEREEVHDPLDIERGGVIYTFTE